MPRTIPDSKRQLIDQWIDGQVRKKGDQLKRWEELLKPGSSMVGDVGDGEVTPGLGGSTLFGVGAWSVDERKR
jgi:hypothetical protein